MNIMQERLNLEILRGLHSLLEGLSWITKHSGGYNVLPGELGPGPARDIYLRNTGGGGIKTSSFRRHRRLLVLNCSAEVLLTENESGQVLGFAIIRLSSDSVARAAFWKPSSVYTSHGFLRRSVPHEVFRQECSPPFLGKSLAPVETSDCGGEPEDIGALSDSVFWSCVW